MENYKLAERLYQIAQGLDEVWQARKAFPSCVDDLYKDETMAITGARDRISEIATLLAKDEATSQEIDKQEQDEVDEVMIEREMENREADEQKHGEEREQDLAN